MNPSFRIFLLLGALGFSLLTNQAFAETPSFSDVPEDHAAFPAVEYLKAQGYVSGYEDGTFRPDQLVTRSEAAKLIVAPLAKPEDLAALTESVFTDMPKGSWDLPYVEYARQRLTIIDGPPKQTTFRRADPVLEAEFLKMFLLAQGVDPDAFGEIELPLGGVNPDDWHYRFFRSALSSTMIMADDQGLLSPGKKLTRGDVALRMFRFFRYREGRRAQAGLTVVEREIVFLLAKLGENNVTAAEEASARALIAARGVHASRPDVPVVKAALKIAEAFRALVRGYRAGLNRDFDAVIALSGEAWRLADQALEASADMQTIVDRLHDSAKAMADSARTLKGQ